MAAPAMAANPSQTRLTPVFARMSFRSRDFMACPLAISYTKRPVNCYQGIPCRLGRCDRRPRIPFCHTEPMCRSIKTLRRKDEKPTDQEIHDAALQFVRKISGYRAPSRVNTAAFDTAVKEVSVSSRRLLSTLA